MIKTVVLHEVRVNSENMVTVFVAVEFLFFFPKAFFMITLPGRFKLFCPGGAIGKESAYQSRRHKRCGF